MQKFYEKEDITLFQGDCIEILNRATPESIDMIFADPPYMLSNGGITCQSDKVVSVNKAKWDKMVIDLNDLIKTMTRGSLVPIWAKRINGKYIVAVYQGSLIQYDILIKYRQLEDSRWSSIRTPKHIHWAVDILIKMYQDKEKTKAFLNMLIEMWNNTIPIKSLEQREEV